MPKQEIIDSALAEAIRLGADVAGYVPAYKLIGCPSDVADGHSGHLIDHGTYLILGLCHDPAEPELDFWEEGRGTPGDRMLRDICSTLSLWLCEKYSVPANTIPYQIDDGGIYLKDAACMAGLGIIGRNNLVLVPGFGPNIRFRAIWADIRSNEQECNYQEIPCTGCAGYCMSACPMRAFSTGKYSREQCIDRMNEDKRSRSDRIEHCRICELVCPAWIKDRAVDEMRG